MSDDHIESLLSNENLEVYAKFTNQVTPILREHFPNPMEAIAALMFAAGITLHMNRRPDSEAKQVNEYALHVFDVILDCTSASIEIVPKGGRGALVTIVKDDGSN